ncbi:Serpentine receptor class r-10 [Caenorhabditis elegans]|uniref:Serpentine receptor class r-10 n=1 Tax=Caenorhabditis elegans TaxID=6239 RepID=Q966B4_CAEEL|nr:Seven TM Receptor [Caenorhabditis elegans]CCD69582.1 Seven TM Receptor [Caenorhabditis elegans]|eukprot:NP_503464.2 Seven TM Receptor [Caenorhabditis elegans]
MFSGLKWGRLLIHIQQVSAAFSILTNIFLIHLILNKSPTQIGAYKFLMLYFSFFEIFYGIVVALTSPFHHTQYATYLAIISAKDRDLSHFTLNIFNAMYWGCYGMSLAMFGVHFIYRYLAACGSQLANSFNTWKIVIWFLLPLSFGAIWSFDGYFFCRPTEEVTNFIKDSVYVTFGLKESEFVYLGPRIFQKNENGIIQFNVGPSAGLGLNVMTVNISFLAIFFFGIKCYFCIQNMVKQSASSKSNALQRQLFYALVIQTLIPVIFMQLPFTIVLILCIFDINDDVISGLAVMSIAVYPAIDPLPNIFIIKDYRRALLNYLRWIKNRFLCRKHVVSDVRNASYYTDGHTTKNAPSAPSHVPIVHMNT